MIVKPGQITTISCDFEDWTLDDPNPGRQEFFAEVMSALENNDSGFATFSMGVPMEEGVGGYFTNHLALDQINLPSICVADVKNKKVKFQDEVVSEEFMKEHPDYEPLKAEKAFAIFVHEACHFLHFSRDRGEFTSPLMAGKSYSMEELIHSPKVRREAEFEAGYRSTKYNAIYRLYPAGDRTILETNVSNMMNYDKKNQTREWHEKYLQIVEPWLADAKDENGDYIVDRKGQVAKSDEIKDKDSYKKFMDSLIAKVTKFTEWADPKHEIKGVMDYELPEKEKVDQDVELEKAIALIQSRGMYVTKPGEDPAPAKPAKKTKTTKKNTKMIDANILSNGDVLITADLSSTSSMKKKAKKSSNKNTGTKMVKAEVVIHNGDGKSGIITVNLTKDEVSEIKNDYDMSESGEEELYDCITNSKIWDAARDLAEKIGIDIDEICFGDTTLTFANGRKEILYNPWP